MIGYTSEVDQNDINSNPYYERRDDWKAGYWELYEDNLKGVKGKRYFQKDNLTEL